MTPWKSVASRDSNESPPRELSTDVCVIGAGIAGLSVAYQLLREGHRVAVLDDGEIGSGETGHTTAHLATAIDDRYFRIEWLHGAEGARICAASHAAAIDEIESIVRREQIDCQFERLDGYLFAAGADPTILEKEYDAASRAGVSVERVGRLPGGGVDLGWALCFHNQGQIEPLKYLSGLAAAIEDRGGRLFTHTHAESVEPNGRSVAVRTSAGAVITAAQVVVATNAPVNTLVKMHTKQAAYRTYVIAADVPAGAVAKALYWDTGPAEGEASPHGYHYVRLHEQIDAGPDAAPHTLLIVGGEDHRTGQANDADERWARLERWTRERFPIGNVRHRWSGQVVEPVDGVAFIGRRSRNDERVYIVTGDSGMGMTHGTIAGLLIKELIAGRPHPWAALYDPSRITMRAAGAFLSENLNTIARYANWLEPSEVDSTDEIMPGQGAIMRRGLRLLAVHRDDSHKLHVRSAVCTHLGGIVAWNDEAQSWDCPCHGSRFDATGCVLNGPANHPLAIEELNEHKPALSGSHRGE